MMALVLQIGVVAVEADTATVSSPTAKEALQEGYHFELNRRWGEGVRHYESATRKHPNSPELEERLLVCRVHADVERRYVDSSFVESVDASSTDQVLELYAEVLSNLETYYVERPEWSEIQRHGTAFLEVALTEPKFIEKHLANIDPKSIEEFRLNVHRYVGARPTITRFDLRANVAYVAGLARSQLGISGSATVLEYVCGAIGLLDPYTRFLTRQQLEETLSNIKGNFVGLGVELKCLEDGLRIVSVITGGPAAEAGLKSGDMITAVNDSSVREYTAEVVADMLRGPEGSHVNIVVSSDRNQSAAGSSKSMSLQRRRVEVPSIENVHIADEAAGVAYLRLTTFQETTISDLDAALWDLHRQGMRSLIIDLRGNPGGLLQASVEAADRFLADGKIVSTHGRHVKENFDYVAHRNGTWGVPLVVLIDRDSASASEIFAGAIHDHQRGRLIGETSYGKGSVQGIFRMQTVPFGLCLTTAKFYSPSGRAISRNGVEVDEEINSDTVRLARPNLDAPENGQEAADAVLTRAIDFARQSVLVSQRP